MLYASLFGLVCLLVGTICMVIQWFRGEPADWGTVWVLLVALWVSELSNNAHHP